MLRSFNFVTRGYMTELVRASLSIDEALMKRFDHLVERSGLGNRSEAIRDLIRARLMAEDWDSGAEAVATVTLLYDHSRPKLARQVEELGHQHHHEVLSSLHIHLSAETCLEVVVLRGAPDKLRHLANHLVAMKGVIHGQVTYSRVPGDKP